MKVDVRFKQFYERVKDTFPYNDIKVTPNRFHVKWLLMSCKTDPCILFYHAKVYPLLCTTVDAEVVQQLILTKQGLPLPADFSDVLDCMFHWGRSLSWTWYSRTLELINFYLCTSDLDRASFKPTHLYLDIIQMRVLQLINRHFRNGHSSITEEWLQYFRGMVNSGKTDFFELAVSSFQYTNRLIDECLHFDNTNSSTDTEVSIGNDMNLPAVVGSSLSGL